MDGWRKSSHSSDSANCVEFKVVSSGVQVRDSKHPDGPVLNFSSQAWRSFVQAVRTNDFQ